MTHITIKTVNHSYQNTIKLSMQSHTLPRRIFSTRHQTPQPQCPPKLTSIINTFRENNIRLMQQIQQSDKKRQSHVHTQRKIASHKLLLGKYPNEQTHTFDNSPTNHQSLDRIRRFSKKPKPLLSHKKKQNLVIEQTVEKFMNNTRSDHKQPIPHPQHQIRVVKINLDRLVPLSIDRLRERMKML